MKIINLSGTMVSVKTAMKKIEWSIKALQRAIEEETNGENRKGMLNHLRSTIKRKRKSESRIEVVKKRKKDRHNPVARIDTSLQHPVVRTDTNPQQPIARIDTSPQHPVVRTDTNPQIKTMKQGPSVIICGNTGTNQLY